MRWGVVMKETTVAVINEEIVTKVSMIAAEIATSTTIAEYEKQKKKATKQEQSKRLHNAKLLLKHYKTFKAFVNKVDVQVRASLPADILNEKNSIIQLLEFEKDIVGSIKKNTQQTIVMVQQIDKALETLEYIYEKENNARYYDVLRSRYIDGLKVCAVAELYNLNERTVYKVVEAAAERLAILLFGVYGIKIE